MKEKLEKLEMSSAYARRKLYAKTMRILERERYPFICHALSAAMQGYRNTDNAKCTFYTAAQLKDAFPEFARVFPKGYNPRTSEAFMWEDINNGLSQYDSPAYKTRKLMLMDLMIEMTKEKDHGI